MKPKYKAQYTETKDILVSLLELFHVDKAQMTIIYTVLVFGPIVLAMMFIYGEPGSKPGGLLFFFVKFLCGWAACFFAADIMGKTFVRSMQKSAALGDGIEVYKLRMQKRSEPMVVKIQIFEDRIVNTIDEKEKEFLFTNVKKMMESEKAIGFLVYEGPGPKRFFGIPKSCLEKSDINIEEVKAFLLERCIHVKKYKLI